MTVRQTTGFDTYVPSEEQLKQAEVLREIIKTSSQENVDLTIIGGYGLDGLYGQLTRDHKDIDILVEDGKETKLRKIIERLGFTEEIQEKGWSKIVYKGNRSLPTDFKVEFAPVSLALGFLSASVDKEIILPKEKNGKLLGFSFKTPTLKGHRMITDAQNKRAVVLGWGAFSHKDHLEKLMKVVSNQ